MTITDEQKKVIYTAYMPPEGKKLRLNTKRKPIYGWGINDADYVVEYKDENGKYHRCPFYSCWRGMVKRCHSGQYPIYSSVEIHSDWKYFSNFKSWMEQQDWEGKELDKDLLSGESKIYSPETCVFLEGRVNKFLHQSSRGVYPTGVTLQKASGRYLAHCYDLSGTQRHLGVYATVEQASQAYMNYKCIMANELADTQTDLKIINALRAKYKKRIFTKVEKETIFKEYLAWANQLFDDLEDKSVITAEELVYKVIGLVEEELTAIKKRETFGVWQM